MKLYTTGQGHWAGTQADARKLKKEHGMPCDIHEVPVAKQKLLDFLNGNTVTTNVARAVPKTTTSDDSHQHDYLGKTTILVGGYFHKLHCYYYTENWPGIE